MGHLRLDDGVHMSKSTRDLERAQAAFHKKEMQAREGASATAEYKATVSAERAKTERLRALRIAKEEQDRVTAANKAAMKAATPVKPAVGKKKRV